ncbi:MAG: Spy/CpxP family protein refolding chaperone [Candidatus Caenarcaniphilales bacterium]|nr:Spy/CpxP family protein refolding chaperone [Candidatus Caenarcaniphilales bacterium]
MKKLFVIFSFLLAFVGLQGPAMSFGPHPGKEMSPLKILENLNLSKDQKRQIAKILRENQRAMQNLTGQIKSSKKELMKSMEPENFDEQSSLKIYKQMTDNGEKLILLQARIGKEINQLLTEEQRVKAKEEKRKFITMMDKRMDIIKADLEAVKQDIFWS